MFIIMFFAFGGACVASICTYDANSGSMAAPKAHKLGSSIAKSSTFHIQLNTLCHHFNVFFLGAGRCAMITNSRASQARVYTIFVLMISIHI
jgi:hypothetical protein